MAEDSRRVDLDVKLQEWEEAKEDGVIAMLRGEDWVRDRRQPWYVPCGSTTSRVFNFKHMANIEGEAR